MIAHPQRQLLLNVGLGFAASMLLLLGVIALAVMQMAEVNRQLEKVVAVNNVKTRLATRMRDTLRDRAIVMHDIVVSIDPWEKDALFQQFLGFGERYAKDRAQLIAMQESAQEKNVMSKVDEITRVNQPVMFQVVSSAMDQNNYGALTLLQEQAIPLQNRLVGALDDMTQLQREANENALRKAYQAYQSTRNFILALSAIAAALAVVVAISVSRRVSAQTRQLETEKFKFQTLFESNSDAVVILDDQGFIDCNPATLEMFRLSDRAGFLKKSITELGAPVQQGSEDALAYALRYIDKARQDGHAFMEWTGRRADGSDFPSEIALHAMRLGGRPVIQAIMRDISQRKEAEIALKAAHDEALSAAKTKSEFIANVSHEIRTPLHGIMGMADLLMREPLTGAQREYAATLRQSAQGLLSVINDILDFSKIEAGKLNLEQIPFIPAQVIENAVALYRPRMLEKGLAIDLQIAPALQVAILGDPNRLRQILLNLLDNAIKFTPEGQIGLYATALGEARYMIEIEDEGIGITENTRKRMFSAFSQADASTTRHFGGTGLGLAICQQLVGLMGGDIAMESPPAGKSHGTLFRITLPRIVSARAPAPQTLSTDACRFKGRVLIAEDNPVNQKVLSYQLSSLGVQSVIASTGQEAVDLAASKDWDLILMDWQMPEMDGFAATRKIRQLPAPASRVPIVALTAQSGAEFQKACEDAGMSDYLAKPYEEAALISVLSRWLTEDPTQDTSSLPLDLTRLAGGRAQDAEVMQELARVFIETCEAALSRLEAALKNRDALPGKREAHSLRGAAAAVAATRLFDNASALETAFASTDWVSVATLLSSTQAEFLRLKRHLDHLD